MKFIYLLLFPIFLVSCEQRVALEKPTTTPLYRGKVKKISYYVNCNYDVQYPNPVNIELAGGDLAVNRWYSESGILIREEKYAFKEGEASKLSSSYTAELDDKNNIIEERKRFLSEFFPSDTRTIMSYDSKGNQIEKAVFNNEKLTKRQEFKYDDFRCVIKELDYDSLNRLENYTIYKYNNHNNVTLETNFDRNNNVIYSSIYKYKINGDLKKEIYRETGKKREVIKEEDNPNLKKDKKGNWLEYTDGNAKTTYEYDKMGHCISESKYNNNNWVSSELWKYRDDGVLLEYEMSWSYPSYHKSRELITNDYYGNEVKRERILSGGQRYWEFTLIDYY
jgi:hypothetical protein